MTSTATINRVAAAHQWPPRQPATTPPFRAPPQAAQAAQRSKQGGSNHSLGSESIADAPILTHQTIHRRRWHPGPPLRAVPVPSDRLQPTLDWKISKQQ